MAEPLPRALDRVRAAVTDDGRLVRAVGSGRRRGSAPAWRRIELRYVDLKAGRRLQVTSYDDKQAHTRNLAPGTELDRALDELLREPFGNWHVDTTTGTLQLRVTKKGDALVHERAAGRPDGEPDRAHDRSKQRLLDDADPLWHTIGIGDHQGRIKPSRQAKYRQVQEFVRALDAGIEDGFRSGALRRPDAEHPLRVVDLGCGNAYLTFAAFAYLQGALPLQVQLLGVDVRSDAVRRNNALASDLGFQDGLRFVESSVADVEVAGPPDVVLALHACDTATDEALARAVQWAAPVVLAAPCCHHDLQEQLRGSDAPAPYGLLMQHGILRERMADVLTDSLRTALLRQCGYRVEVMQFVETRHTPRDVLLRAVRTGAPPSPEAVAEYAELTAAWGIRPALARMLGR